MSKLEKPYILSPVLAPVFYLRPKDENAVVLVASSDHVMPATDDFHAAIQVRLSHAQNRNIVT